MSHRRIAAEPNTLDAVGRRIFENPFERRQRIIERCRERVFRRQPVIEGENVAAASRRQRAAKSIVRIKATGDRPSTMKKDDRCRRFGRRPVNSDRSPRGANVFDLCDLRARRAKAQEIGESRAPRRDVQRCDATALQRKHVKKTSGMRIEGIGQRGLSSCEGNFFACKPIRIALRLHEEIPVSPYEESLCPAL